MFKIDKENVTFTEADFAVDFLCAIKGALCVALFIMVVVCFVMWEITPMMIRLFISIALTTICVHFVRGKYKRVLQEYLKDIK